VALVRVEQLYPFPERQLKELLDGYSSAEVVWAQEEPENMGAWRFMERELHRMGIEPQVVARQPSPTPATGSLKIHQQEQHDVVLRAL
jgi:2-oxoglutarate dehydrogenase E1 component